VKNFIILSLISITLIFIACNDTTTGPTDPNKEIMPVAVGNYWTFYKYEWRNSNIDTVNIKDSVTNIVTEKIEFNGQDWFKLGSGYLYHNGSLGLIRMVYDSTQPLKAINEYLYIQYPVKVGDVFVSGEQQDTMAVINTDKIITVPAGTFHCVDFQITSKVYDYKEYHSYMSPGVGQVMFQYVAFIDHTTNPPDSLWRLEKLASYKINK
jgi:hypothetical protein